MNRVSDVSESLLTSFYISGLKSAIQCELLVSRPTSLGDAFALARVTEASKFLFLMTGEDDESPGIDAPTKEDEALESRDISILNSLVGHGSPRSLQLWGTMGACEGPGVVLGIQWLRKLGKVTHDYAQQTMKFTLANKTYSLQGDEYLRMKRISFHRMQALLETNDVYGIYKLHNLSVEEHNNGAASKATGTGHSKIDQFLIQFDLFFQVPTSLPPHRLIDHRILLLPNTKPINVQPYRYPHYQKGEIEKLVNEMLREGIIRFSYNPFSSLVLLVKKKDGSFRFCVDYRALNAVTIKDKFLIPTADEMFDELGGASIFTKLDLRAGYHQIRVYDRDIYKTAFRTHDGHYEFLVIPYGLTNAPSTFQAKMNRLFSPYLRKFVIVFFDDILIYSTPLTAATLEYLGRIISNKGVEMDPKKITVVIDWPIDGFKWGELEFRAFEGLKKQLTNAPVLELPNFNETFVVE
ncbi:ty3-gypsy retrotransposon protein [Tanacetum coccineum]